jgi:hypothetical protein
MANILEAFGTAAAFTTTNANLAPSATAGWKSNAIDNSASLYDDALVHVELAAVNTAPAGSKCVFLYAYALVNGSGSAYTSSGDGTPDGSEGTIVFPDVTANPISMPLLGTIPYPVQNKAINAGPFGVARCFGGVLPPEWGICMVNDSGMTLNVTAIRYVEVKYTAA